MTTITLTITEDIEDDGHVTTTVTVDPDDAPVVTLLGLLELAKDTILTDTHTP